MSPHDVFFLFGEGGGGHTFVPLPAVVFVPGPLEFQRVLQDISLGGGEGPIRFEQSRSFFFFFFFLFFPCRARNQAQGLGGTSAVQLEAGGSPMPGFWPVPKSTPYRNSAF